MAEPPAKDLLLVALASDEEQVVKEHTSARCDPRATARVRRSKKTNPTIHSSAHASVGSGNSPAGMDDPPKQFRVGSDKTSPEVDSPIHFPDDLRLAISPRAIDFVPRRLS